MARYTFSVGYNDPNVGFQIQDAVARVLAEWEGEADPGPAPAPAPTPMQRPAPAAAPAHAQAPRADKPQIQNPEAPASEKQLQWIVDLVDKKGLDWNTDVYPWLDKTFQTTINDVNTLNKGQASATIDALNNGSLAPATAPF